MPEKIDTDHLPRTGMELFGRQKELERLDEEWASGATNVLSFVAWGGVGKSTLINKWLERMAADNYRGARRVFAWSFYSQGTSERATPADLFISAALQWFDGADPLAGSAWDKGERLARLVRQERTLLLLDGMEPLQSGLAHERGKIKDPALATLVEELARANNGLCVITTRERISELDDRDRARPERSLGDPAPSSAGPNLNATAETPALPVQQINLELLSPEAGRALLRFGGVRGTDEELERAVNEFGCHALALNLLAAYLQDIPGHPIAAAAQIPDLDIPVEQGKHPRRVIAAFEEKFGDGPEVQVLRILGLFDRPADGKSIEAIRKPPKITKLTDHKDIRAKAKWFQTVQALRRYKLIAQESRHRRDELDAHPLVREHFGRQMKRDYLDAWRAANLRLYDHLTTTTKEFPDTVEEMAPLYAAVAHGCAAGRHQQVLEDVYWRRIQRGEEAFSIHKLGAFGIDLAALTGFFARPWVQLLGGLTEQYQAFVLNQAGADLRALGRMQEAAEPMQAALQTCIAQEDWKNAAIVTNNLSELYLTIGNPTQALSIAKQSVQLADRSGDEFERMSDRSTLANVLHQAGQMVEAAAAFHQAEEMQKQWQPGYPILYSLHGFHYCDLLLSQGKHEEVKERVARTIEWAKEQLGLLDVALDNLSLGRACLLQSQQAGAGDTDQAAEFLQRAVAGLRQAGIMEFIARGLLARAELRRVTGEYERVRADLDEAQRIAERGQMGLHLADCHLERARLCLALGDRNTARTAWATAKAMITAMGYGRRDGEVAEIERQL